MGLLQNALESKNQRAPYSIPTSCRRNARPHALPENPKTTLVRFLIFHCGR